MTSTFEYSSAYFMKKLGQLDVDTIILYNHLLTIQRRNGNIQEEVFINLQLLFTIIKDNLPQLACNNDLLKHFMALLHNTIHLNKISSTNIDQSIEFLASFKANLTDSKTEGLYLQFVHQILQTFIQIDADLQNNKSISKDVVTYMFSESALIQARAVICCKILLDHFEINVLSSIWKLAETTRNVQVLTQVFEYFLEEGQILTDIRFWQLLVEKVESYERSEQKYSIYIMKRILNFFSNGGRCILSKEVQEYFKWDSALGEYWSTYFTIFENLFANQSHLILPSLEFLKKIRVPSIWMNLLLSEMLKHKNVLVLKWSVKYVLESLTIDKFNDNILTDFMAALNNTFLYANDSISVDSFINTGYRRFMNAMLNVEWKSVPFHSNLKALQSIAGNVEGVDFEFLINLAIKIRKVQNRRIRYDMRLIYFRIFDKGILKLCLNDGLKIIESLFNKHEALEYHTETILVELLNKSSTTMSVKIPIKTLEILTNGDSLLFHAYQVKLFTIADLDLTALLVTLSLNNISGAVHNTVEAKISNAIHPFSLTLNEINIDDKDNCELNFIKLFVYLHLSSTEHSNNLITYQCLALIKQHFDVIGKRKQFKCDFNIVKPIYVDRLTMLLNIKLNDLFGENVESLIDLGSIKTMQNILFCLQVTKDNEARIIERILMELKFMLKKRGFDGCLELCNRFNIYCICSTLGEKYLEKLIDLDHANSRFVSYIYNACNSLIASADIKFLIKGLLYGEPLHGEQKLEYDYANNLKRVHHSDSFEVRQSCFRVLFELSSQGVERKEILSRIKDNLLNASIELNKTKPRYFDNSEQHRLKLRLVQAIAVLQSLQSEWDDRFLVSIFNETNQNNVTYIMELVIAQAVNKDQLVDMISKLSSYQNSALPSVFAINYMACRKFDDPVLATKSVELILPWTMAQHYRIRLNAQIVIYHLLKHFKQCGERFYYLGDGIYASLQQGNAEQNLTRLNCDFRYNDLNYTNLLDAKNILVHIPRITNMATDELYLEDMWQLSSLHSDITSGNMKYSEHAQTIQKNAIPEDPIEMISNDLQRKMIPNRIEVDPKFLSFDDNSSKNDNISKMFVVASLITKVANLGGIARTCEVLGIKNLVIDSLKLPENKDFQTLSLTAEKWLNIDEVKTSDLLDYLNIKKSEGYLILGAEQTTNSVNFVDFKFPEKCVLLLGHEKEGIPANLIGILDHAIEIPQFGFVRSLNVHVTGALFMWEYCKQYLAK